MTKPIAKPAAADQGALIDGPAGPIEVALDLPEEGAEAGTVEARNLVAVLCHPLPTEGGTMHNKVVTMAARALRECGATTVRFNFRGVGKSAGSFDEGDGELEDLRAVVAWARAQRPGAVLWLAGFSFGAWVALRAA
ncbi:MAG TPA: alpha/beta fold hydrolase, partial [Arenimonas sp.]|nr:alpha/beta fold hydrolase [Arenimonas sp.]